MIRFLQQDTKFIKILFWIIIVVACVAMVIFLIPGLFNGQTSSKSTYATINRPGILGRFFLPAEDSIPLSDVQNIAQRELQRQNLPDFVLPFMMQRVGQGLIQQHLELLEAKKLGITATNDDVRRFLHTGQWGMVLFPNGKFIGTNQYAQFVSDQFQMTTAKFESELRNEIIEHRLQNLITGGVTVSDTDVRDAYVQQATKIAFTYAVLDGDTLRNQINPTDAQLETYFKQNASKYATAIPEARKIEYVSFTAAQLPTAPAPVTQSAIAQYYQQHLSNYQVAAQVKVRHILIAVNSSSPAADAAAKAKAQSILDQLHHGANFAELAKKYSDDPGSKAQGGELGWITHGVTVPNFDKAAFALEPGQTSGLVRTKFGYHIIQCEAKKAAHTQPLSDVQAKITATLTRQNEQNAEQAFAQQLASEAAAKGIAAAAAAHHLTATTTDYIPQTATLPNMADSTQLLSGAFAAKQGAAPEVASTGDGFAVYQVTGIQAAHAPTFAAYKSTILNDYRTQQLPQLLATKVNQLAAQARTDGSLAKAAKALGATVETSGLVGRDSQVPDIGQLSTAAPQLFDLSQGQMSGAIDTGHSGVVAQITQKQLPTGDEISANFDTTREALLQQRRDAMYEVFISNLETKYEKAGRIRINERALQAAQPTGGSQGQG